MAKSSKKKTTTKAKKPAAKTAVKRSHTKKVKVAGKVITIADDGSEPREKSARLLPSKKAVVSFCEEIRSTKLETSQAGQELSTAAKTAQNAGVDLPAARLSERIYGVALRDAAKGRVFWENVQYYLLECLEFDKVAPESLFPAEETRSTRGEQADLEDEDEEQDNVAHLDDHRESEEAA